jgi:hypothetical protein
MRYSAIDRPAPSEFGRGNCVITPAIVEFLLIEQRNDIQTMLLAR